MEKLNLILQLITIGLSLVFGAVVLVMQIIKYVKLRKSNELDKQTESEIAFIDETTGKLLEYIAIAEEKYNSLKALGSKTTGEMKLSDVLAQVKIDCLNKGIKYDNDFWANRVDKLVDLTKKVNVK